MKTTAYFRNVVSTKHPEIKIEWVAQVMDNPVQQIVQSDGRIVRWGNIAEAEGRALRIVLLEDGETVHNAFFDRNFWKRQQRGEEPK
ncbi:MAG: hypothetical protein AAGC93_20925 [Cyanobacteria bacterium P01_F01_bin.53]